MPMPSIDLFALRVPEERLHPVFTMLLQTQYAPERAVLQQWAEGFVDRDGKFVEESQTTFESGLWELYVHACLREFRFAIDMSHATPDFVITRPAAMSVEATIAAPAIGGRRAYGAGRPEIPADINEFNREATLRICNAFSRKSEKHLSSYSKLTHVADKPYVVAIGAFDRPFAHMAANRPILAALYGTYHDEEATIVSGASQILSYDISVVTKRPYVEVPVGLFCDDKYARISAVMYSALATWGKVRALADNPSAKTIYTTFHPNPHGLEPQVRTLPKSQYREHLLDGFYVLHNPFATYPIPHSLLAHARLAQIRGAGPGELEMQAPHDFLLMRTLISISGQS